MLENACAMPHNIHMKIKKKIIKALCLGGLVPPMLSIRHHTAWDSETRTAREIYEVSILRGAMWEFVSTHDTLAEANKSFGKQLDKAIEAV